LNDKKLNGSCHVT